MLPGRLPWVLPRCGLTPSFWCAQVILSNALYFSPLPAVYRAWQTSHLGNLNVLPQALMVVSTNAWMCYALSVPNIFIMLSNLPGAIAAVGFVSVTLPLIPRADVTSRLQVQLVLVVGTAVMLSLWSALIFGEVPHETIRFVMGAYGSVICVLLFASPLSRMRTRRLPTRAVAFDPRRRVRASRRVHPCPRLPPSPSPPSSPSPQARCALSSRLAMPRPSTRRSRRRK